MLLIGGNMIQKINTNRKELSIPGEIVTKNDDIKNIVQDLKDTLASKRGWGISATQIFINKKISYIKLPPSLSNNKEGWVLINGVITVKSDPIKITEGCLSFPGISVITKRHNFIAVEYLDEKLEQKTAIFQNYEASAVAHELDHQSGILFFGRKWVSK